MKRIVYFLFCLCLSVAATAQGPRSWSGSEILQGIRKLNVLGSVLYLAAHPDDENTRLITYLANEKYYRTGYLSLTRGDGGQNLIGEEQGIELGLIRTQELLAARRMDGGEQFFTRAFDFGFSKNPEETFTIWNRQLVLSDVVWVIRKFQPDVIITRFPTTGEGGHGHHTASAILANEAFKIAADPRQYPGQLKYVKPWQARRILWNTFNFGGTNTTAPSQFKIDAGGYNASLGKSYGEIAALSRSQHKSQGFGSAGTRGESWEYFKTTGGSDPVTDLMDGVDLSWNRVGPEGKKIAEAIRQIEDQFSVLNPAASVKPLVALYQLIRQLPEGYWKQKKMEEVRELIRQCCGLFLRATSSTQMLFPDDTVQLNANAINRSGEKLVLKSIRVGEQDMAVNQPLEKNRNRVLAVALPIAKAAPLTQPYWLQEKMAAANYTVSDQQKIGIPDALPAFSADFTVEVDGASFTFTEPVLYHLTDPVKGELYEPVIVTPRITVQLSPKILLFQKGTAAGKKLKLDFSVYKQVPGQLGFGLEGLPGATVSVADTGNGVFIPVSSRQLTKPVTAVHGYVFGKTAAADRYGQALKSIHYDHIPYISYFFTDSVKLLNIDLKTVGKKIGYIPGAGDKVPEVLAAMGYQVVTLDRNRLLTSDLSEFDAIVSGVRAYNIHEWLNEAYDRLMAYVRKGGNLIVQYNTNNNIGPVKAKIGPYDFSISRNRITDEQAEVRFIDPAMPVLHYPNEITGEDFKGWIQERSTYHAANWDAQLKPVLVMHDPGEPDDPGALVTGRYGKGCFTYCGVAFFRQLPAAVPGAIRLFANIIALNSQTQQK
ncbi:PIG-L family deacetylase [Niabella drilacis]|uniref:GlcNAc-PI de-N-acetylase n=1 Tax=Niabella drilacis (strain DSM 25811 / CCM 8410 / CCUG 62505 / LMG 26954 / E90) TaxID=1285928 RepID=A0A1G6TVM6_NIADE|nr:PIG-L family deacetylase [Niabella drilacis]SDD33160.1 GlcNAc-PI de-N-acetylase [Niabella drilacis]